MADWAGAHLHTFIEGVQLEVLACSDAACSTHLLSRCRMYERIEHGNRWRPNSGELSNAPLNGHIQLAS